MQIISITEAKTLGLTHYFTGKICKRGHLCVRRVCGRICVECVAEYNRIWKSAHPGRKAEYNRNWYAANSERVAENNHKWSTANPEIINAKAARRRATKLHATPSWLTSEDRTEIKVFYQEAKRLEQVTGVKHHVDHIIPLQGKGVRGLHVPWNLQILTESENISKGNRYAYP